MQVDFFSVLHCSLYGNNKFLFPALSSGTPSPMFFHNKWWEFFHLLFLVTAVFSFLLPAHSSLLCYNKIPLCCHGNINFCFVTETEEVTMDWLAPWFYFMITSMLLITSESSFEKLVKIVVMYSIRFSRIVWVVEFAWGSTSVPSAYSSTIM